MSEKRCYSALSQASHNGHKEIVEMLLKTANSDINIKKLFVFSIK